MSPTDRQSGTPTFAQPRPRAEPPSGAEQLLTGGGEMGARMRAFDWPRTSLGPVEGWPAPLRTVVRLLLDARQPMFLWWGPELVQFYNDGYRPSLGETPDRHPGALGAHGREFWAEIWPIIGPEVDGILAGGPATWHENHLVPITRNGRREDVYWTYGYSPVRDETGAPAGVLVTVVETTAEVRERTSRAEALERQRRQLETIAANATLALFIMDERQCCTYMNAAAERLTGFALAQVQGKPLHDHIHHTRPDGSHYPLAECPIDRAFPQNMREQGEEVFVHPDGSFYPVAFTASPILEDGVPVGTIIEVRDIREEKARLAERERLLAAERRARTDAEAANRAKSEFLATMSHELRTPLNAIGGYAELIELGIHGPVTEPQRTALERIQRSQRHLLGLIAGVLDYSRVEAGAVIYRLADVPVIEAVAEAELLVAPQLRAKGLGYAWSGAPPALRVRADREKLQQILLNLLGNAVKFTNCRDGAPGRIEVSCSTDDGAAGSPSNRVCIHVRDTGDGIAPEQLERIFEPFVQADQRLTRANAGIGLGLAISRDLARGMGGDLTAESTPGVGSTFTLTLPPA